MNTYALYQYRKQRNVCSEWRTADSLCPYKRQWRKKRDRKGNCAGVWARPSSRNLGRGRHLSLLLRQVWPDSDGHDLLIVRPIARLMTKSLEKIVSMHGFQRTCSPFLMKALCCVGIGSPQRQMTRVLRMKGRSNRRNRAFIWLIHRLLFKRTNSLTSPTQKSLRSIGVRWWHRALDIQAKEGHTRRKCRHTAKPGLAKWNVQHPEHR